MLSNGMGGLDWAGVSTVAELLGVQDLDAFLRRLTVIKTHRPDKTNNPTEPEKGT